MKLYYWPKTRAFRALWMLEEIGAPYELVRVNIRAGEQGAHDFCRVNPMTKLPALDDDGVQVAESGAVLLYLADQFPGANLGAALDDPLRGRFLQWLFFTPRLSRTGDGREDDRRSRQYLQLRLGRLRSRRGMPSKVRWKKGNGCSASASPRRICCWPARCRSRSWRSCWSRKA